MQAAQLGERIAAMAAERGLTLEQLAEKADVNKSQVGRIVRGLIESPRLKTIQGIAQVLGVTVCELTGEHEVPEDPVYRRLRVLLAEMNDEQRERVLAFATFEHERYPRGGDERVEPAA